MLTKLLPIVGRPLFYQFWIYVYGIDSILESSFLECLKMCVLHHQSCHLSSRNHLNRFSSLPSTLINIHVTRGRTSDPAINRPQAASSVRRRVVRDACRSGLTVALNSTGNLYKAVPRFGEFCSWCCLPLLTQVDCSILATWEWPYRDSL